MATTQEEVALLTQKVADIQKQNAVWVALAGALLSDAVQLWVANGTYVADAAWRDPSDNLIYRANVNHSGSSLNPSVDTVNWRPWDVGGFAPIDHDHALADITDAAATGLLSGAGLDWESASQDLDAATNGSVIRFSSSTLNGPGGVGLCFTMRRSATDAAQVAVLRNGSIHTRGSTNGTWVSWSQLVEREGNGFAVLGQVAGDTEFWSGAGDTAGVLLRSQNNNVLLDPSDDGLTFNTARAFGYNRPAARWFSNTDFDVAGALSKSSGTFSIPHPVREGHRLVHSFVEGPRADNIYRGKVEVRDGFAEIDLDAAIGLTPGTFVALNRADEADVFLQPIGSFHQVHGALTGNMLAIHADVPDPIQVSWMVVAERHDPAIRAAPFTNRQGRVILEPQDSER